MKIVWFESKQMLSSSCPPNHNLNVTISKESFSLTLSLKNFSYLAGSHVRDRPVCLYGLQLVQTPVKLLQCVSCSLDIILVCKFRGWCWWIDELVQNYTWWFHSRNMRKLQMRPRNYWRPSSKNNYYCFCDPRYYSICYLWVCGRFVRLM